ncbi:aspartyl-phosphate phosphatase Spo0E family protein [Rossellomorea aquimaris]|nr:aspartyl-phosphate phosphatase Spo0E family protein [Rossellomorea aquimaris]
MVFDSLENLVEHSRGKMIYAVRNYGMTSEEAIQASQELDELLIKIQCAASLPINPGQEKMV